MDPKNLRRLRMRVHKNQRHASHVDAEMILRPGKRALAGG
jgi:hypothetical protein